MIYKNKNILFIILLIFAILVIGLLNYFVDPYDVIHKSSRPLKMYEYPSDMYSIAIKLSKDTQYDYLVMGASATKVLIDPSLLDSSRVIFAVVNNFDILVERFYLKFILNIHPEIKTIIFPVEYLFYFINDDRIPKISDTTHLTFKEIIRLLLNIDTTKKSIKNIKKLLEKTDDNIGIDSNFHPDIKDEFGKKQIYFYNWYKRNYNDSLYHKFKSEKYDYLKELKDIVKDRKIIFVIPPYHSIVQGVLFLNGNYDPIEKVKQLLVENYPNAEIYDFAYINKYTTVNIETPHMYSDVAHPNGHYGTFYYCALKYPNEFKDKDVFVKLNKDNIDKTLEWQRTRLEDYSTKNSTYIKDFMKTIKRDNEKYSRKILHNFPKNCQWYIDNY